MQKLYSLKELTWDAVVKILVLAAIFVFSGFLIYHELDTSLKASLEESVTLHSQTIAYSIDKQFEEEFNKLAACSTMAEQGKITYENLLELSAVGINGEVMGIISKDQSTVIGMPIPSDKIDKFKEVFDRKRAIKYFSGYGLVFAMPININGEICMLYDCFNDEAIRRRFNAVSYDGEGTLILMNGPNIENCMMLSTGKNPDVAADIPNGWMLLDKKFRSRNNSPTAMHYEHNGQNYFMHITEVSPEYHFAVTGYVPWKAVAVGIDYIYSLLFTVIITLIIIIVFAGRYLNKAQEAKHYEQEKAIADLANNAKSEFLSNMSHEIRTPINAIMGMNEMVIRECKDKNILEYSENLQNAARTLLNLVNDILDFSKIEAGKMEIIPVEYHTSSTLNDIVVMTQARASKKKLEFQVHVAPDIPSVLFGDETRLKQIIVNILTNAVKYTEEGNVTLDVSAQKANEKEINLFVRISDTGIGIKKEDIKKLFCAFERIEEERNRHIEGTGLGMNITQKLLTLMGSHLEVESKYGKGSKFCFTIRQKVMNYTPIGNFQEDYKRSLKHKSEYHELFTAPDATILVVDDTIMNLTVVKGLLKNTKIKIDVALNGAECLQLVLKKKYDIIFLDHRMPGMDGLETLAAINHIKSHPNVDTPVIALTANAISGAREMYLEAGFHDYLTKPIQSQELEKMILKYLPKEKVHAANDNQISDESEQKELPEWLLKIDELDVHAGVNHCGSVDAYLDALTIFAESIIPASNDLENYCKSEDWKNFTTKVHALKSTARVVGLNELSERARRLEDAGNSGYYEEILHDAEPMLILYRSYSALLSPLLNSGDDSSNENKPLLEGDELVEAYEIMRDAVQHFDYDALLFVFKSLEDYRLPPKEAEKYPALREAIAKLDWEKLKELIG